MSSHKLLQNTFRLYQSREIPVLQEIFILFVWGWIKVFSGLIGLGKQFVPSWKIRLLPNSWWLGSFILFVVFVRRYWYLFMSRIVTQQNFHSYNGRDSRPSLCSISIFFFFRLLDYEIGLQTDWYCYI